MLRLLRLLRLVRAFAGIYRAGLHLNALARHKGFAWLLLAWLGVMALCSAWMYVAERGLNKAIESPFDALWWGVVTLTTVGYGDVYPVTTEGRIAAMALMLLGIGLFGAITATITSYLMTSDGHHGSRALVVDDSNGWRHCTRRGHSRTTNSGWRKHGSWGLRKLASDGNQANE